MAYEAINFASKLDLFYRTPLLKKDGESRSPATPAAARMPDASRRSPRRRQW